MARCNVQTLLSNGWRFAGGVAPGRRNSIRLSMLLALLQQVSPDYTLNLNRLLAGGACFRGLSTSQRKAVKLQMLCELLNSSGSGNSKVTPQSFTLSASVVSSTEIDLSWSTPVGTSPIYYTVWQSTDGIHFNQIATQNGTTLSVTGLTSSTEYWFYVVADNLWGSRQCNTVNATTNAPVLTALIPAMTSNTAPSGTCSASSFQGGAPPYFAFDGNSSTQWQSTFASGAPGWIQYQFPSPVAAVAYDFTAGGFLVQGWILQASINGSTWVNLDTQNTQQVSQHAFSNAVAYAYWRIYITSVVSGNPTPECNVFQLYNYQ